MQLAPSDELVDVGGIATVVLLGLLLAASTQQEPDAADDGAKPNDAHDDACGDTSCVGFAVFFHNGLGGRGRCSRLGRC